MANKKEDVMNSAGTIDTESAFQSTSNREWYEIVDVGWEEHFAKIDTGITMCYQTIGPENGKPIILLHGGGDSRISWSRVAPILAENAFRVYVPDLRGHGKTDVPVAEKGYYTLEDYATDIVSLMDKLRLPKVDLVGHSLGSMASQIVASTHPEKVQSITLIATGATAEVYKGFTFDKDTIDDKFLRDWASCKLDDPDFVEATYQHVKYLTMKTWKQMINGIKYFDTRDKLQNISCPVQMVWGTEDKIFSVDDQEIVRKGLTNTKVLFVEMKGCSHSPHWDSWENIQFVAEKIVDFVKLGKQRG